MSRVYLSPPHLGGSEAAFLLDAVNSNWIAPFGPHVEGFESDFVEIVGVDHAVALSSGTAALHLALLALGVGLGDEVLVSDFTFAAAANAVTYVGARPAFVDCDESTWQMDPGLLIEELSERARLGNLPKAVIAVDLYGQCADYGKIPALCSAYNIPLIEDAAESLGASYAGQAAGALGDIGVFSFNGNKIVTSSGGGMLASSHADITDRVRYLSNQAREPVAHYEHKVVGYNYRMSNLLAAFGRAQLRCLDDRVARRRQVNSFYRDALAEIPGIGFMPQAPYGVPTWWLTCITIDSAEFGCTRQDVMVALEKHDIEARPTWKPMHLQPVFANLPVRGGSVSEGIFADGLCLPSGSSLEEGDMERVVDIIRSVRRRATSTSARRQIQ